MPQLHETGYGRDFFGHQLPKLIKNIENLSQELKRANDLKEQELFITNFVMASYIKHLF